MKHIKQFESLGGSEYTEISIYDYHDIESNRINSNSNKDIN